MLGCGASPSWARWGRGLPSGRRASASAWRPDCSIELSASRVDSWPGGSAWRSAPACTTITLTLWATRSCSSRAIRARSSATASRAQLLLAFEQLRAQLAVADGPAQQVHGDAGDDREQDRVVGLAEAPGGVAGEVGGRQDAEAGHEAAGVGPHRDPVERAHPGDR